MGVERSIQLENMPAEQVARLGFSAWQKGRPVVITGRLNRFLVSLPRLLPRPWMTGLVARAFRNRR
ncbi:hypothetical protein [Kroppenstedtia guangzhouensis]|nr:hypothetical protein [Kroppenstedtia guangzhouensis]